MPSKEKRVYTFDQLDAILRRRGTQNRHGIWLARIYSTLHVTAFSDGTYMSLRFVGSDGGMGPIIATVYKAAEGDTMYQVWGIDKYMKRTPQGRAMYRKAVQRFTPRTIVGRTPISTALFRIHDGVARPCTQALSGWRDACSLAYVPATRPTCKEWLEPFAAHHPKLCGRARSFYLRLRRELRDGLPCIVQIGATPGGSGPFMPKGPSLHVCLAPPKTGKTKRIRLVVCNHEYESRKHFGVDGDFGHRHAQVYGWDADTKVLHRWRSTKEATVGVKEWVMSSVYIPGF